MQIRVSKFRGSSNRRAAPPFIGKSLLSGTPLSSSKLKKFARNMHFVSTLFQQITDDLDEFEIN
jgi:hypothetical protein